MTVEERLGVFGVYARRRLPTALDRVAGWRLRPETGENVRGCNWLSGDPAKDFYITHAETSELLNAAAAVYTADTAGNIIGSRA